MTGSTGSEEINSLSIPTGGDVILEVAGRPLNSLDELLADIAFSNPGEEMELTVLHDGQQQQVTVTLEARPQQFDQFEQ